MISYQFKCFLDLIYQRVKSDFESGKSQEEIVDALSSIGQENK